MHIFKIKAFYNITTCNETIYVKESMKPRMTCWSHW